MTVFAFGPRWKSNLVREAEWVDTPVGRTCVSCLGFVTEGDQGVFVGFHGEGVNVAEPIHLECFKLAGVSGGAPNTDLECPALYPPMEVLLAAIDHGFGHASYSPDADIAFDRLCNRLGVNRSTLTYERGWAKKYLT